MTQVKLNDAIRTIRSGFGGNNVPPYIEHLRQQIETSAESIRRFADTEEDLGDEFPKELVGAWARLNAGLYAFEALVNAFKDPGEVWLRDRDEYRKLHEAARAHLDRVKAWYTV